jgi:hypothetical protein
VRVLVLALAAVGVVASAALFVSTFPSGGPFAPDWTIWPVFVGCIAIHLPAIRIRGGFELRLADTPRAVLVPAAVVGVCAFVLAPQTAVTARGNPERHGRGYYLRNHTELTRVSRAEYRYAERKLQRGFSGIALVFYLVAIILQSRRPAAGPRGSGAPGGLELG